MSESLKTAKRLLTGYFRELGYRIYLLWFKHRLARLLEGELYAKTGTMLMKRLGRRKLIQLDDFLIKNLSEKDMRFSGITQRKLNYSHPGFLYFGIYSGEELAALWWVQVRGRNAIEASLAVTKSQRGSGILDSIHDRNEEIYDRNKIDHRFRINEENTVMLEYYKKKSLSPSYKEGHLYIYEITY